MKDVLHIRIDVSDKQLLLKLSASRNLPVSDVCRSIIKSYLAEHLSEVEPSGSAAGFSVYADDYNSPWYHQL